MCLLGFEPEPKKRYISTARRASIPPTPRPVPSLPSPNPQTYPLPTEYGGYVRGWIKGQTHAEAQIEKAKRANAPNPTDPPGKHTSKQSYCCHDKRRDKRRFSHASSISVRSFWLVKKKFDFYKRQAKEQKLETAEKPAYLRGYVERGEKEKKNRGRSGLRTPGNAFDDNRYINDTPGRRDYRFNERGY